MKKTMQNGWDRVDFLEKEIAALKSADKHDSTVEYLIASAEIMVQAAKVLIEIREKRGEGSQVELHQSRKTPTEKSVDADDLD